ncbi:hypothetical protein [Geobacter anodireducens]
MVPQSIQGAGQYRDKDAAGRVRDRGPLRYALQLLAHRRLRLHRRKNLQTDEKLPGVARHIWDLGFHYDDRTFRGALTGAYRWWNTPGDWGAKYNNFIWDLNLGWRFFRSDNTEAELFATGHNLFNGAQYHDEVFKNPSRWFEGGLRIKW